MVRSDRRYLESHEWAKKDGNVVTVGITAFAVEHLSDLTFLSLPSVGTTLKKGDRFGEIESVKAVSELFAPVGGKVTAINQALVDDIASLTGDPWEKGWMLKLQVASDAEWSTLLDGAAYEKKCADEH
ncbi:MAG: glycine cleavage system protein GcvH [Planctomycetes bacterium]|nr:glycine cleavage system protein GcvH [Planctomycetota bacterium]